MSFAQQKFLRPIISYKRLSYARFYFHDPNMRITYRLKFIQKSQMNFLNPVCDSISEVRKLFRCDHIIVFTCETPEPSSVGQ